jgi:phospholipid/cholesterol/gamma-HCH transport system permease protein
MPYGGEFILRPRSWRRLGRFGYYALAAALSPSSYSQKAREMAVEQIYLFAWRVLAGYLAFSALLSLVLIEVVSNAASRYGVSQYALELVLRVLVLELIPLMTALFVALRSGSEIAAQIALMRVNGELEESAESGESPLNAELVPRVVAAAASVFTLTTLACALAVFLTYTVFYGFSDAGFVTFTRVVANVFDEAILAGFLLKCLLFGLAVALIPLATGLEAEPGVLRSVPFTVLAGLVKLFFVIGVIAVLSLVVKYT